MLGSNNDSIRGICSSSKQIIILEWEVPVILDSNYNNLNIMRISDFVECKTHISTR